MADDVGGGTEDGGARLEAARLETRERQYRAYVQWAERLIDRRAEANRFYLALNSAILGAIGFLFSDRLNLTIAPEELIAAVFAFLGVMVSWNWRSVIKSQREIVGAKFAIVHDLEARLPSRPYNDEWDRSGGKRRKLSAGRFELRLPTLFTLLYLAMVVWLSWLIAANAGVGLDGLIDWAAGLMGR